jgi:dihydrodipicolinate synthase/N-acetylneuraminate lyase
MVNSSDSGASGRQHCINWLLSSLVLGCNGLLSGSGSVIPDLQSALFRAVRSSDLEEARRINDRIYPPSRGSICITG